MDEIELFRQIVASCDEALKDVFLRRMEASVRIARAKLSRGESVYSASDEQQLLRSMSSGLSLERQSKARSLWKALLRMSRNRQYRVFLELDESLRLNHEHDMTTQLPQGPCVCTADLVEDVETLFGPGYQLTKKKELMGVAGLERGQALSMEPANLERHKRSHHEE